MRRLAGAVLAAMTSLSAVAADSTSCSLAGKTTTADWQQECDRAIGLETRPTARAALLFRRAYVRNGKEDFAAALQDLDQACILDPHNPRYLHERGYTRNSLGDYQEALVDLNEQALLQPDEPTVYRERAWSLRFLGDLRGAFTDRNHELQLLPDSAAALLGRADDRLWLGEFAQATADATRARAMAERSNDAATQKHVDAVLRRIAAWSDHSPEPGAAANCDKTNESHDYTSKHLIGDCTLAFLAASTGPARAAALTIRSIAWLEGQTSEVNADAADDRLLAVAFDPGNADMHSNLGFSLLPHHHSRAALREFDRSLAIKTSFFALAGRASARHNLGDSAGAFADAKASFDLQPNELALLVLGDLAFERNDVAAARQHWLGAYHLGSRDDRTFERLRSVGIEHPEAQ